MAERRRGYRRAEYAKINQGLTRAARGKDGFITHTTGDAPKAVYGPPVWFFEIWGRSGKRSAVISRQRRLCGPEIIIESAVGFDPIWHHGVIARGGFELFPAAVLKNNP